MDLVTVRELYRNREEYLDKEVTIGGWVRSIRDSKTFGFIVVNDGSFFENLQVVYHDNMENFGEISKLNVGAAIIVKGTLVATPQASTTAFSSVSVRPSMSCCWVAGVSSANTSAARSLGHRRNRELHSVFYLRMRSVMMPLPH